MEMLLLQLRSEVKGVDYMYAILEICNKIESSIVQNNGNDTHP